MKFLSFGEILWDLVNDKEHLGGAPLNLASHISQIGVESYILSALGTDNLGINALNKLKNLNVKTDYIKRWNNKQTGTVLVTLKDGQPTYDIIENVAWDNISLSNEKLSTISEMEWDCFCFGSLAQRSSKNRETLKSLFDKSKFKHVFFDINLRQDYWSKEIIEYSLNQATIFKINEDEINTLSKLFWEQNLSFEKSAKKIINTFNISVVCITLGSKGALVFDRSNRYYSKGKKVVVADTVGAGDSFSAAFLYTYLKTNNLQLAIDNGSKLGGFVASCHGAIPIENKQYSNFIKKIKH